MIRSRRGCDSHRQHGAARVTTQTDVQTDHEKTMTDDNRPGWGRTEAGNQLLRAALFFVDRRGAAAVEHIAHEADYSAAALCRHLSIEDDLLRCLWPRGHEEIFEVVAEK